MANSQQTALNTEYAHKRNTPLSLYTFFKDTFWIPFALNTDFAGKIDSAKTLLSLNTFFKNTFLIPFALSTDFCREKCKKGKH